MKIRTDFVTNSSSSSFIIFGKEVAKKELGTKKGTKYVMFGDWLSDGQDVVTLTTEMIALIQDDKLKRKHPFFLEVDAWVESGDSVNITFPTTAYVREVDYHSTSDLDDFKRRYVDEDSY